MINEAHLQHKLISSIGIQVLIAGHIVSKGIVGLPATKQGESRTELHLNTVIHFTESRRGNVANLIAVVHITCRGGQGGLKTSKHVLIVCNSQSLHTKSNLLELKTPLASGRDQYAKVVNIVWIKNTGVV